MAKFSEEDYGYGYDTGSDYGYGSHDAAFGYEHGTLDGRGGRNSDAAGRAAANEGVRTQALPAQQFDPYGQPAPGQQQRRQQGQPTRPVSANQRAAASASQTRNQQPYGQWPANQQAQASAQGGFVSALDTAMGGGGRSAYDQYSRSAGYSGRRKPGMSRGKKVGIVVAVVVVIAALVVGVAHAFSEMRKAEVNADLHNMDKEELEAIDQQLTGHTSFDEPFTVLLLGSDARAGDPGMGARTDTIILVRVDPLTNTITMMSIPRDTMVYIDGVGIQKINAAYTYGGASGTIAAVRELTGIDVDHYAEINFEGLVDLIDAIGGIDVYVDEYIDDPDAGDIVIPEGEQHLDGAAALVFSRSRAYADGDYSRQKNQRKVIDAIIHKGLEAPASELTGLIQASTKFLTTDSAMDFDFIYKLADQIRHNNDYPITIYSANIPSAPAYIGEISYVIADTAGVAEMAQVFLAGGDISQPMTQSSISTDIANAGGSYGSSSDYYYESNDDYYYYEEPSYEEPEPVYEEPVEVVDDGGGEASDEAGGEEL